MAKGFVANKKLGGFVFPGIDPKILKRALRKKKRMSKRKKAPPIPEPSMGIGPIAANGSIGVDFSVDMIAPSAVNQRVYQKVFQFGMKSDGDGSMQYGAIMKK